MRLAGLKYVLIAVLCLALGAGAQVVHQVVPVDPPTGAYVTFKFDWDQGHPWVSYTIAVDDAGNTHFEGVGNAADSGDGDTYRQEFHDDGRQPAENLRIGQEAGLFPGKL